MLELKTTVRFFENNTQESVLSEAASLLTLYILASHIERYR